MKKILIVSGSLRVGGLETVAMNFRRYSDINTYKIDFLVFGNEIGGYEEEAKKLGCNIIRISRPGSNYFGYCKELRSVLKKYGPYDIVHVHTFFNSGIVVKVAKKCGVKRCITHVHSGKRANNTLNKKIKHTVLKYWINKYSDIKCACSKRAGDYVFGKKIFDKNGIVVPNVIEIERYVFNRDHRDSIRKEFGIDDQCFVIGNVGHMLPVKNQTFLIKVFSNYLKKKPNSKLIIVGDGAQKNEIQKAICDENIANKVILTGTRNDVNRIMSSFDVFVLPSLHEGLPVTLVESMANGLYYIIEEDVVPDEMKKFQNCLCVKSYNLDAWVDAIFESEKIGRRESTECIDELSDYSPAAFGKIIQKLY